MAMRELKATEERPPFWNTGLYGKPARDRPTTAVPVHHRGAENANGALNRPRARPKSAIAKPAAQANYQRIQATEDAMRRELKSRRKPHATEKDVFIKACKKVGAQVIAKSGKGPRPRPEDLGVSPEQFQEAWRMLNVDLRSSELTYIFNTYGQATSGLLPCAVFADALLVGRSRLVGIKAELQKGAFDPTPQPKPGFNVKPKQRLPKQPGPGKLKIMYPECRKGVFPPSSWKVEDINQSSQPPHADLELEHVYGYAGRNNTASNIFYINRDEIVYYTAGTGIVCNMQTRRQRFFREHSDDITSIAVSPKRDLVSTGQVVTRAENGGTSPAFVSIWDPETCVEVKRLIHGEDERSVIAQCFSPDCKYMLTVTTDNNHTVHLWHIESGQVLTGGKGRNGAPPQVYGVEWSEYDANLAVTYGVNHVNFWRIGANRDKLYGPQAGDFGKAGVSSAYAAKFLSGGKVVTGATDGSLLLWQERSPRRGRPDCPPSFHCVRRIAAHAKGPMVFRPDGGRTASGVRGLCYNASQNRLVSAGADGNVIHWRVSEEGEIKEQLFHTPVKGREEEGSPPCLRALDVCPGQNVLVVGTSRCDIWEVDESPEIVVPGHSGEVRALAVHPVDRHTFVTASMAGRLYVWNMRHMSLEGIVKLEGFKVRSVDFSPDGHSVALGFNNGGLKIFTYPNFREVFWTRTFTSSIDSIKFSPDGSLLAAGSHDTFIDIFDCRRGYARISRCQGHSSTINHMDWSEDGDIIMTNSQAYEVLYFHSRRGKQVVSNQRDTEWSTWTCILGFPVMGIWHRDSDGTDINAVDRSNDRTHIATADDLGKINLFRYPCVVREAPRKTYRGHSSHVMNIKFTCDDRHVISVGGKDRAVFQWRTRLLRADEQPPRRKDAHELAPFALDPSDA